MVSAVDDFPIASHTRVLAENWAKLYLAPDLTGRAFSTQTQVLNMAGQSASKKRGAPTRAELKEIKRLTNRSKNINSEVAQVERNLQKAIKGKDKSAIESLRKDRQVLIDERKENQALLKEINDGIQSRGKVLAETLKQDMTDLNRVNRLTLGRLQSIDPTVGASILDAVTQSDVTAEDEAAHSRFASVGASGVNAIPGMVGSYLGFGASQN